MNDGEVMRLLWRGSLLPLGGEAVANPVNTVNQKKCRGALRTPAGASSLATGGSVSQEEGMVSGRDQIHRLPRLIPAIARYTGQP